jgi:hypothetical protein
MPGKIGMAVRRAGSRPAIGQWLGRRFFGVTRGSEPSFLLLIAILLVTFLLSAGGDQAHKCKHSCHNREVCTKLPFHVMGLLIRVIAAMIRILVRADKSIGAMKA